jgi:hypothetical protein
VRSSSAWASLQPQNRLHAALGGFVVNAGFLAASTALKSQLQSRSSRITQDCLHGDSCLTGNPVVFPCQAQSMATIPTFTGYGGPILSLTGKQRAQSTVGMLASLGRGTATWTLGECLVCIGLIKTPFCCPQEIHLNSRPLYSRLSTLNLSTLDTLYSIYDSGYIG